MKHIPTAWWLLTTLGVATVASAAGTARQNNRPLSAQERAAMTEPVLKNHRNFNQPTTEAQAQATLVREPDGVESMQVPTSLWNHLSVQKDAQGNLRMVEHSGDTAPTHKVEGLDHE